MYRLREWNRGDVDRLLEAFAWEDLVRQEPGDLPRTPDQAREWIAHRTEQARDRDVHGFAVVDGQDKALGHVQISVGSRRH